MSLEIVGKGKYKELHVDNKFFCVINDFLILKYKLKSGITLDKTKLDELKNESELELGFGLAVDFLSHGRKTEKQVKDYLIKKISLSSTENIIEKLKSYHYLDDFEFAKSYIESQKASAGVNKIKQQLILKGVDRGVVDSAINEVEFDDFGIQKLIKKYMKNKENSAQNLSKLNRFLLNKGYTYEEIKKNVSIHKENDDEGWD